MKQFSKEEGHFEIKDISQNGMILCSYVFSTLSFNLPADEKDKASIKQMDTDQE